jgi:2-hydroxychromene-2-carboxylate isomerase
MKLVELFWDVASPYTYLAHTQIAGLRERTRAEVRYRPFLLGGVFKATDNLAPGANPFKASYLLQDLRRWRELYRVPMRMPAEEVEFPLNSVSAMRVAIAADREGAGPKIADVLLRAYWVDGLILSDPAVLSSVLTAGGFDAGALLAAAQTAEVKDQLRANSDEAVRRGAFGAPTMFIGEEMFWGNDRLAFVEARLSA